MNVPYWPVVKPLQLKAEGTCWPIAFFVAQGEGSCWPMSCVLGSLRRRKVLIGLALEVFAAYGEEKERKVLASASGVLSSTVAPTTSIIIVVPRFLLSAMLLVFLLTASNTATTNTTATTAIPSGFVFAWFLPSWRRGVHAGSGSWGAGGGGVTTVRFGSPLLGGWLVAASRQLC